MLNVFKNNSRPSAPAFAPVPILPPRREMPQTADDWNLWINEMIELSRANKPFGVAVDVTPLLANVMLERNVNNRDLSAANVRKLSSDMTGGRFAMNGEAISISNTGILLNGQNRLTAVIRSGVTAEIMVNFGIEDAAQSTMDQGKKRTIGDIYKLRGLRNTTAMGALVSLLVQYKMTGRLDTYSPTTSEMDEAERKLHGLEEIMGMVRAHPKERLGSPAVLAFCAYLFAKATDFDTASEFMRAIIDNDGLRKGDPEHYCRRWLQTHDGEATDRNTRAAMIISCWNARRCGKRFKNVHLARIDALPRVER